VTFNKRMSDTLGIPIEAEFVEKTQQNQLVTTDELDPIVVNEDANVDADYAYARKNLRDLIERGMSDLEEIASIARSSENPRAFEVMNGILKTVMDANKDLLELAKSKKDLKQTNIPNTTKTVNNNLIVAPTSKIQQIIEDLENNESD